LSSRPVTTELAAEAIKDMVQEASGLDHTKIIASCAAVYGLSTSDLVGGRRTKQVALARQVAMYLMRTKLGLSLKEIGGRFGGKDHTTVMHAIAKIEDLKVRDVAFESRLRKLVDGISRG
jgi:chromosomal replication initiator protein